MIIRPRRRHAPLVVLTLFALTPAAAKEFTNWSPAVNIGSPVNTSSAEGCPFIAKSDVSLFVVSTRPDGYGGQDIYVSQRDSIYDPWGPLQNLGPDVNTASNELCPTLSIDGHRLYFVSDRPGGYGKQDLYVTRRADKRNDFFWDPPVNLGGAVNSPDNDFTPTLFDDPTTDRTVLYFSSDRPGGMGGVDIYSSTKSGEGDFEWALLVPELSTGFIDERPNVRKDGLEIFFDSNRPGSLGSTDLWVSTRSNTSEPWSPPVNLGADVNSVASDMRPSLSFDGTILYFNSTRTGGAGSSDVYATARLQRRGPD